ncbi:F0F1 ATP synthase subunit delta [Kaarinaea lacus]
MELSWSTFLLEIINFLVLVWILKRFLYRPVMEIIEKRRNNIEDSLNQAKKLHSEAELQQQQYENRLADWEREKQHARDQLAEELQVERNKLFQQLNTELTNERQKAAVIEQRQQIEMQQHLQEKALTQGARFAAKILHSVASVEVQNKLIEMLLTQLAQLPEEHITSLQHNCKKPMDKIIISSAFVINTEQQQALRQALQKFCDPDIDIEYNQDAELIAGLRVTLGSWVLRLNLQDELSGFAALSHE